MATVQSSDGTTIDYDSVGSGPAVVLVEGATAFRGAGPFSQRLSELLADEFTVYTYDRRGRGKSGDHETYEPAMEFADLDAVIAAAGGTAAAIGISSGAVLALEAALAGSHLSALALYEPPFVVTDDRPAVPADYIARLRAELAQGKREGAAELFLRYPVNLPEEFLAGMKLGGALAGMAGIAHTLPYDATIMHPKMSGDPKQLERFARVTTPSLVLHGSATEPWIIAAAKEIAEVLPNVTSGVLPDQTHDVSPELLAPAVAAFFAKS